MGTVHCHELQLSSVADATVATAAKCCSLCLLKSQATRLIYRVELIQDLHQIILELLADFFTLQEKRNEGQLGNRRKKEGATKARAALALQITQTQLRSII